MTNGQNGQKKKLETQLWNIADSLRGKMNADEFRDYCLGFIFYKYLSERQHLYANEILAEDGIDFLKLDEGSEDGQEYLEAIKDESIATLGYFLKPSELFSSLVERALGAKKAHEENLADEDFESSNFILDDLAQVLNSIERSTMGKESEEDFDHLFEDLDLTSTKLGRTPKAKNALIAKILVHLNKIDFRLEDTESDVLGDAYEYLIGQFASGAGKKAGEFYTPQQVSKVLAKIAENDFNLNIPRYVDTFEEEEEINLDAVAREIREIDRDMVETDRLIRGFCEELGIEAPF